MDDARPHGPIGGAIDAVAPGRHAVDPPAPRVPVRRSAVRRPTRHHRRWIGLSGSLLFACMFLPAVDGCHAPVMPYEVPPFLPPYLYGLVFAGIAIAPGARGLRIGALALRALGSMIVIGSVLLIVIAPQVAMIELILGMLLLATIGLHEATEPRVAASGIAAGVISVVWFGCWAVTPEALIGVHLALACSIGLCAGCLAWLRVAIQRPAIDMPVAIAAVRRRR